MRHLFLIILALATLFPSLALGYDILVLQSSRSAAYEEVLKGFRTGNGASQRLIVLSDYAEVDVIRIVREDRPQMILAIGDDALASTGKVQGIPVVTVMSLNATPRANLTVISMFAPPGHYCNLLKRMQKNRVGIIHNPRKTGWYMQQVRKDAADAGIELVVREVTAQPETLPHLAALAGKVDALWLLPDTTAVTRETVEAYFLFGQQHRVPVISFASSFLGLGAAGVIEINRTALGQQARDISSRIMEGGRAATRPMVYPQATVLNLNQSVLKKLGLSLNDQ